MYCTDYLARLQPLQVFGRPSFKRMINIASRASRGVKLPSLKQTRGHIIKTFKEQVFILRDCLNVSIILSLLTLLTNYVIRALV